MAQFIGAARQCPKLINETLIMQTRTPNILKCDSFAAQPKTPAQLAELSLSAAARSLPDDEFANDPAVIRAAAEADAWTTRLKRLAEYPAKRKVILDLTSAIEADLNAAREAHRFACLDSFLANDHEFTAAISAWGRVELLENRLQAARTAKQVVDLSFTELSELRDLAGKAMSNLQNIRFELKRQAVMAQKLEVITPS